MKAFPLVQNLPRSRYLIFVGALLAIPLVSIPWVTATISYQLPGYFGPSVTTQHLNGLHITSRFLGISNFSTIMLYFLLFGSIAPGIVCSIWIRGRIQSRFQLLGVVVFSAWVVLLTCLDDISLLGLLSGYSLLSGPKLQQIVVIDHVLTWRPEFGLYLLIVTQSLLWVGLGFVWYEIYQNRDAAYRHSFQRQSPSHYLAASIATLGAICWFVGYYGFYWFLPKNCPPPAPFGFAQCNNRLDAPTGFLSTVNQYIIPSRFGSQMLVLALETLVVVGGFVLLGSLWVRNSTRSDGPWYTVWLAIIILFSGSNFWATQQIAAFYVQDNEQMTIGFPLTLLGLLLLVAGFLFRWQRIPQLERPASQHVKEGVTTDH